MVSYDDQGGLGPIAETKGSMRFRSWLLTTLPCDRVCLPVNSLSLSSLLPVSRIVSRL